MTRKILLLTLLTFGCAILTPKTGHTTYMKGQSIMEQSKVTLPINGDEIADNGTATIGAENVYMRLTPEDDGPIVLVLYANDVVKVLGRAGGWLMVSFDVYTGYVWAGCFIGYEGGCR